MMLMVCQKFWWYLKCYWTLALYKQTNMTTHFDLSLVYVKPVQLASKALSVLLS